MSVEKMTYISWSNYRVIQSHTFFWQLSHSDLENWRQIGFEQSQQRYLVCLFIKVGKIEQNFLSLSGTNRTTGDGGTPHPCLKLSFTWNGVIFIAFGFRLETWISIFIINTSTSTLPLPNTQGIVTFLLQLVQYFPFMTLESSSRCSFTSRSPWFRVVAWDVHLKTCEVLKSS